MATGAGVVVVLLPQPALAAILVWLIVVVLTRYVSVASICAAATICVVHLSATPQPWSPPHNIVSVFCLVAAGLVVVRHAGNLRRLLHGTENRLKESQIMMLFSKTLHVLALGLWFGSVAFFVLSTGLMFEDFKKQVAEADQHHRWPGWFVLPDDTPDTANNKDPELLKSERASRAFGAAVGPVFPWYFGIQLVCGFIAYGTALSWQKGRERDKAQSWRAWLLLVALLVTLGGWWLEGKVSDLRIPRNEKTDRVLKTTHPTQEEIAAAKQARDEFTQWHLASLFQNFLTLALVTVAMALAAQLPANGQPAASPDEQQTARGEKTPATV